MPPNRKSKKGSRGSRVILAVLFACAVLSVAVGILVWRYARPGAGLPLYRSFGIHMPRSYAIFGIDVSRHQSVIGWGSVAKMREKDVRIGFAFMKATEGVGHEDTRFPRNWKNARRNGIPRGAYHYFLPDRDPAAQADLFISKVRLERGDLPPVLDVEERGSIAPEKLRKRVRQWLDIVERHYGVRPILYTNVQFYEQLLGDAFDDYPLWVAHYLRHERPRIRRNWSFWQFSERARVSGIRGYVDFNAFQGDSTDFRRLLLR